MANQSCKPGDSGNVNDFLNDLSSKFEFKEKWLLISGNDDFRTTSDSLEQSDNGKLDDWCQVNDCVNDVSPKPDDDHESSSETG
jgi:hypothetical protein